MFNFGMANDEQKSAVTYTNGPLLIIAGPGTGKTFTLVKRIAYLVLEKNIEPSAIMVVTFTEKAARELITRISDEFINANCDVNIGEMYIGTFHAICLRLLKEMCTKCPTKGIGHITDSFEQYYLVYNNFDEFSHFGEFKEIISGTNKWNQTEQLCTYINKFSDEAVDVNTMLSDKDTDIQFAAKIIKKYREILGKKDAVDFSGIQTSLYDMLSKYPDALSELQDKIKYFMVDEYQDTNYIQEQLILTLGAKSKNICVVGDDDQSLYRFRGASVRNILEFEKNFQKNECKVIKLCKNYRSEKDIVEFYSDWMRNNDYGMQDFRHQKNIQSVFENSGGAVFACGGDIESEKRELVDFINKIYGKNVTDYNQIAVLLKSVKSNEALSLADYFEENGIPIYSPRSDMFFKRNEVREIIGCIMCCFFELVRETSGDTDMPNKLKNYYIDCLKDAKVLFGQNPALKTIVLNYGNKIQALHGAESINILDIFYDLLGEKPFCDYLNNDIKGGVIQARAARNLAEVSRLLAKFGTIHNLNCITETNSVVYAHNLFKTYFKCLYIDGVGEYEDASEYAPSGCVSFMTIHQAKGLEFPIVVVGSLGNKPKSNYDMLEKSVEYRFYNRVPFEPSDKIKYYDFWRLYYTAFSRAQNILILASKKENPYFEKYTNTLPRLNTFKSADMFKAVKKASYKRTYSFTSHISIYDGCPRQYMYYKEYGFVQRKMIHTMIGSIIHATLEAMNNYIIDGNYSLINEALLEELYNINSKEIQSNMGILLSDEDEKRAFSQVVGYCRFRKNKLGNVWKAEDEIKLIMSDYILQGIVDLIEGYDDALEIVDYKTGPKPDISLNPERIEHYKKQLEIYAYLIENKYKKPVRRMHLYYTSVTDGENPLISFERSDIDIERTVSDISATVKNIEAKNFSSYSKNSYACMYCDMKKICKNFNNRKE